VVRRRLTRREFVAGGTLAAVSAVGVWGSLESDAITVIRRRIEVPGRDLKGLRLAFLTDWHLDNAAAVTRADRSIQMALTEKPDIIVLGGDYCSRGREVWKERVTTDRLKLLFDAGIPVFGMLGNHDYALQATEHLKATFEQLGMTLLVNRVVTFQGIQIAGIDDMLFGEPQMNLLEKRGDGNTILLVHEPDFVPSVGGSYGLALSGHTHGGQVCWAPGAPIHLPKGGRKYVHGEFRQGDAAMYVSRGIGMTGVNLRVFAPPELTILDLA
jgi:predicted MPP superfamily phosphohydrolase